LFGPGVIEETIANRVMANNMSCVIYVLTIVLCVAAILRNIVKETQVNRF
jgi:hypothetical protein